MVLIIMAKNEFIENPRANNLYIIILPMQMKRKNSNKFVDKKKLVSIVQRAHGPGKRKHK